MEMTKYKLADLCVSITDGEHGSVKDDSGSTYFLLNNNNITESGIVINSKDRRISKKDFKKIHKRTNLECGDLVIATCGTLGKTCVIKDSLINYEFSRSVGIIKCNRKKLLPEYLHYFFLNPLVQSRIVGNAKGGVQKHFYIGDMKDFEIQIPILAEQKKIASVLSALDDKIALNKKMNQKLEAMAKRLYDYWFVQYDFPDKNGHPYKTTGGPMTYNPTLKREIPVGWEVKTLKECIKHINTGLNPRDNFVLGNGDIKYVTVKNLTMEGNIDFSGCDFIDEDALKKVHKRSDIAKGDVLYASICPLGRSYLINKDPVGWDINESVFSIRPNLDVISSEFLSVFLKDSAVVEKASKMATGSIFKGIRIKELENMILAVPVKDVMEKFSKQIKNLIELEHKNTEQIAHLTTLRDKLLPLLMNGQVVVG